MRPHKWSAKGLVQMGAVLVAFGLLAGSATAVADRGREPLRSEEVRFLKEGRACDGTALYLEVGTGRPLVCRTEAGEPQPYSGNLTDDEQSELIALASDLGFRHGIFDKAAQDRVRQEIPAIDARRTRASGRPWWSGPYQVALVAFLAGLAMLAVGRFTGLGAPGARTAPGRGPGGGQDTAARPD